EIPLGKADRKLPQPAQVRSRPVQGRDLPVPGGQLRDQVQPDETGRAGNEGGLQRDSPKATGTLSPAGGVLLKEIQDLQGIVPAGKTPLRAGRAGVLGAGEVSGGPPQPPERERPRGQRSDPVRVPRRLHRELDRKSTRLNSSHVKNSYAVFCLKKKKKTIEQ